jgi:hypothetical protein
MRTIRLLQGKANHQKKQTGDEMSEPEMTLTGKLHAVFDAQTFPSGFVKREFVLETESQYPQLVKFELTKDKIGKLDGCKVGNKISVSFNVRGNENKGRFFVSLQAWKISHVGEPMQAASSADETEAF